MNFMQNSVQEFGAFTDRRGPSMLRNNKNIRFRAMENGSVHAEYPPTGVSIILISLTLVLSTVYMAVFFAVTFPYSLGITECIIFAIFVCSLFVIKYNKYHLIIPLALSLYLCFQAGYGVWSGNSVDVEMASEEISEIFGSFPRVNTDRDISLIVDGLLRLLLVFAVFLLVYYLSGIKKIRNMLYATLVVIGVLTIVLGMASPRDNSRILWFHSLPKVEVHHEERHNYVSPVVHILTSAMNGFMWKYQIADIEISLDQKQISTNPFGGIINENQYAFLLVSTFPFVVGAAVHLLNRFPPIMFGVVTLLFVAVILLLLDAHARGAFLAGLITLFGTIILRKRFRYVLMIFACVFAGMILFSLLASTFHSPEAYALSSGRTFAWRETLELFSDNMLFGAGAGNFPAYKLMIDHQYQNIWYSSHNVYLQLLAEFGLVGVVLWAAMVILFIKGLDKKRYIHIDYQIIATSASVLFIIIYSAFDYSSSIPFNAMVAAISIGMFARFLYRPKGIDENISGNSGSMALKLILVMMFSMGMYAATMRSAMEAQLQALKASVGESIILRKESISPDLEATLSDSIRVFSFFPYSAEYARQIGLGHLASSGGEDVFRLKKARDWLLLSQSLGVNDSYTERTLNGIEHTLYGMIR